MTNNKIEPKHILFIALALSFLALGLWYTFRYQAKQQEIANLKTEIENAETKATQYRQAEAQLPLLREEVGRLRTERAEFVAALPKNNQMAQLLNEVRRNAQASGADIQGVSVVSNSAVTDLPGGVRPIPISMNMLGTYNEVFRTLQSMETMNRFTTVDQLSLQAPEPTSLDPALTGTLNMTVYTFDPSQVTAATPGAPAGAAPAGAAGTGTPAAPAPAAPAPAAPAQGAAQ